MGTVSAYLDISLEQEWWRRGVSPALLPFTKAAMALKHAKNVTREPTHHHMALQAVMFVS